MGVSKVKKKKKKTAKFHLTTH